MNATAIPRLTALALLAAPIIAAAPACSGGSSGLHPVRGRTLEMPGGQVEMAYRDDFRGEQEHLSAPVEKVRWAVAEAYERMGFGVDPRASDATVVATPFLRIRGQLYDGEPNSRYLSCGATAAGRPAADLHDDLRFRLVTFLNATGPTETDVETRIEGEARPRAGTRAPVSCSGTGILEQRVNVRAASLTAGG